MSSTSRVAGAFGDCDPTSDDPVTLAPGGLLGKVDVKNYDGSWTEWGNLVRAPIEKDA